MNKRKRSVAITNEDLAQMVARGFESVGVQLNNVEIRLDRVEVRLDKVESRLDGVESRIEKVEYRLDNIEAHVITTENNHNMRISMLEDQMKVAYPH